MPDQKILECELPTKPTGKSWSEDAQTLLNMGARMIDACTVRGLLEELRQAKAEHKNANQA